jgi:hypothetical protein
VCSAVQRLPRVQCEGPQAIARVQGNLETNPASGVMHVLWRSTACLVPFASPATVHCYFIRHYPCNQTAPSRSSCLDHPPISSSYSMYIPSHPILVPPWYTVFAIPILKTAASRPRREGHCDSFGNANLGSSDSFGLYGAHVAPIQRSGDGGSRH